MAKTIFKQRRVSFKLFTVLCTLFTVSCSLFTASAQFAPQAGVAGSTAISKNSSSFVGWATNCNIYRGWMDIANKSLGVTSSGDSSMATGAPDAFTVSLGDSGVAVLTFAAPIINGPGADFAVFENGFANPTNPDMAFLEFAFVEVSSDGINYFRFPASSHTQDTDQVAGSGVYIDARLVNNLAGKYVGGYGTPFDLQELSGKAGLDVNNITHVRLVDVIGTIGDYASLDDSARKINDPYPTPFPTGGFDLDAVGVIHQAPSSVATVNGSAVYSVFPNPASEKLFVRLNDASDIQSISINDVTGKTLLTKNADGKLTELSMTGFAPGIYYMVLRNSNGRQWVERVSKY